MVKVSELTKDFLPDLFSHIAEQKLDVLFKDYVKMSPAEQQHTILLRHDVDDRLDLAVKMAELQREHKVKATYFILNTAPYWEPDNVKMWNQIRHIQEMGHEIGWHNNVLTQFYKQHTMDRRGVPLIIQGVLDLFINNDVDIYGSASHGDPLCYNKGYLNYDVFADCPRVKEGIGFPNREGYWRPFAKMTMSTYGLQYEAYHVPYTHYLSESGGEWNTDNVGDFIKMIPWKASTQMLMHPQWWGKQLE